ncbi:hypothetical protein Tco_1013018 [Tanacetum coccineum]
MNRPLAAAFTKTPIVLYQNYLREFWCIAVVEDPTPPEDDSEVRPLKEFITNFTVKNVKKSLALNFKTFVESTGLDYNQGNYVAHPSPEVVKAQLAKISTTKDLVQKNPVLKTTFLVAWRILFTFVVQVLNMPRINFRILPNVLSPSNFIRDPSKVTPIELKDSVIAVHNLEYAVLGIKGFYKFLLLVQLSTAKRRLSAAKLS